MSIRKKPEGAVSVLLARLEQVKEDTLLARGTATTGATDAAASLVSKFNRIQEELKGMKDFYPKIKSWEKRVTDQFCNLEQGLDDDIFKDPEMETEIYSKLDLIEKDIKILKSLISTVDGSLAYELRAMSTKPKHEAAATRPGYDHDRTLSSKDYQTEHKRFRSMGMSSLLASFHSLESSQVKMCLLCLSIFPENSVIKKRSVIYWWMGEGLVAKNNTQTAEDVGEQVFKQLLDQGFIKLNGFDNWSLKSFIVYPWVRRMLIVVAKENQFLEFSVEGSPLNCKRRAFLWQGDGDIIMSNGERAEDMLTVFNVSKKYLGMTSEWLAKLRKAEVLHLGRWQDSATHHIEVGKPADQPSYLLNGLRSQKKLKYLSLRGISLIEALPPSILKLVSLQILDLRACHNLEELPEGISALKNLTHLDVSECYLLESMPRGLQDLLCLQVLKGFVIGNTWRNSCRVEDIATLRKLRKLSIRVGTRVETDLSSLVRLSVLTSLTISWGGTVPSTKHAVVLPPSLTKLDLRCVPFEGVPDWLWPTRLLSLDKLYIKGGKLGSLAHGDPTRTDWTVKFLRLEYLNDFEIDQHSLFPHLVDLKIIPIKTE